MKADSITIELSGATIKASISVPENVAEYDTLAATSAYDFVMNDKLAVYNKKLVNKLAELAEELIGEQLARKYSSRTPRQRGTGYVYENLEKASDYVERAIKAGLVTEASLEELLGKAVEDLAFSDILTIKRGEGDGLGKPTKAALACIKAHAEKGDLETAVSKLLDQANAVNATVSETAASALENIDPDDELFQRAYSRVYSDVVSAFAKAIG